MSDHSTNELTAHVYRESAAIDALRDVWKSLAAESPAVTPWQRWDFTSAWWRHVANAPGQAAKRELRLILVKERGRPRLLVPLQLTARQGLGMRWLEPIGMPEDIHRPRFALGALDEKSYGCAIQCIQSLKEDWDGLRIDEKTPEDAELQLLKRLANQQIWGFYAAPLHACPYLDLTPAWPQYLASRSRKLRKNLNNGCRRLGAVGAVRLARFDSPSDVQRGFEILLDVTARSWKQVEHIGLGSLDSYRGFYREWVACMAEGSNVRIYCLYAGERAVAATLAFISGATYYSAQIAHDAAFDACSPGTLLEAMELQDLMTERRFKIFDFLGAALSNKRRWTDAMHDSLRIVWLGRSARARAFAAYYFGIKPRLNSMRRALRR